MKLSAVACPRCGCFMVQKFACNCGAVHGDTCVNCGRFTDLEPTEHVELSETDAPCPLGRVEHEHPDGEKVARIDAFFDKERRVDI